MDEYLLYYSGCLMSVLLSLFSIMVYVNILICHKKKTGRFVKSMLVFIGLGFVRALQAFCFINIQSEILAYSSVFIEYMMYIPLWHLIWDKNFHHNRNCMLLCSALTITSLSISMAFLLIQIFDHSFIMNYKILFDSVIILYYLLNTGGVVYLNLRGRSERRAYDMVRHYPLSLNFDKYVMIFLFNHTVFIFMILLLDSLMLRFVLNVYLSLVTIFAFNSIITVFSMNEDKNISDTTIRDLAFVPIDDADIEDPKEAANLVDAPYNDNNEPVSVNRDLINVDSYGLDGINKTEYSIKKRGLLYDEIEANVNRAILRHELYKNRELKLLDLLGYVNTNRSYLSAAINRNEKSTFYRLILRYRVSCFVLLINNDQSMLLNEAALESGFSSLKLLSKVMKQELGITP